MGKNNRKFFEESRNARNVFPESPRGPIMSGKAHPPELKKFMDKRVHLKINGNRAVEGILRGFDPFMNLVLDETIEFTKSGERNAIGMTVIRGNSVVMLDAKGRI